MSDDRKIAGTAGTIQQNGRRRYVCDNEQCGAERWSACGLATYGTCKDCGTGFMRLAPPKGSR